LAATDNFDKDRDESRSSRHECLRHAEETIALGRRLAAELKGVVLLIGNLGAGKTTLVKGIAAGLHAAREDEVSSPTFTLIHEYGNPPLVYHIDLYRLDTEREVESLGLEDIFSTGRLVLIEWGERFPRLMPLPRTEITIMAQEDESRIIEWRQLTR
jgi:tRNA threonylcarbamoyladenosine biosynthesis protein TsaE